MRTCKRIHARAPTGRGASANLAPQDHVALERECIPWSSVCRRLSCRRFNPRPPSSTEVSRSSCVKSNKVLPSTELSSTASAVFTRLQLRSKPLTSATAHAASDWMACGGSRSANVGPRVITGSAGTSGSPLAASSCGACWVTSHTPPGPPPHRASQGAMLRRASPCMTVARPLQTRGNVGAEGQGARSCLVARRRRKCEPGRCRGQQSRPRPPPRSSSSARGRYRRVAAIPCSTRRRPAAAPALPPSHTATHNAATRVYIQDKPFFEKCVVKVNHGPPARARGLQRWAHEQSVRPAPAGAGQGASR